MVEFIFWLGIDKLSISIQRFRVDLVRGCLPVLLIFGVVAGFIRPFFVGRFQSVME